jgi:hypothetical protein
MAVRASVQLARTALLLVGVLASRPVTAAPARTFATHGCAGAPTWRIGYRVYHRDTRGRTTPRAVLRDMPKSIRAFVDAVGTYSRCGIRITLRTIDMGARPWNAGHALDEPYDPAGDESFRRRGRWDSSVYLRPSDPRDPFGAVTLVVHRRLVQIVVPAEHGASWRVLLHEWLHQVEWFYPVVQGWPAHAIHAARELGYSSETAYFRNLMRGRVIVDGAPRGILHDEWRYFGTPRRPRHGAGPLETYAQGCKRLGYC